MRDFLLCEINADNESLFVKVKSFIVRRADIGFVDSFITGFAFCNKDVVFIVV